MTTRKAFIVRRGDTVNIGVSSRPSLFADQKTGKRRVERDPSSKNILPTELEDDLYVFHKHGCKLYDTGTRPSGDITINNGYFEIKDALVKPANDFGLIVVTQAMFNAYIASLEAQYLDGIFDSTDGRPNKRAFKFASEQLWVDVIQTDVDNIQHKAVIGRDLVRPLLATSFSNTHSVAFNAPPAHNTGWTDSKGQNDIENYAGAADGVLKIIDKIKGINVYAYGFFLDFDTLATTRFKVTETNMMSDPEIVPDDLKDLIGIYLVPYNAGVTIVSNVSGFWERLYFQRLSPYNNYTFPLVTSQNENNFPNAFGTTALVLHDTITNAPVNITDVPSGIATMQWKNNIPAQMSYQWAGALRGVLKTKRKAYYVWLKPAVNTPQGHPYQPDFINVGTIISGQATF